MSSSLLLLIAITVSICDQLAKLVIQHLIPLGRSVPIIKDIFHLTLVFNRGAAFGIFKNQTLFFIIIGLVTVLFIVFYLPRLKREESLVKIAFALILGGAAGNLIDRLRFSYVIDFLDFRIWPVFNLADSCITIGAVLIILHLLKRKK